MLSFYSWHGWLRNEVCLNVICAFASSRCAGRVQPHHIIPRREIRSRYKTMKYRGEDPPFTLTAAIADERNLIGLCALTHHPQVELHRIYITREHFPEGIEDFARELQLEWYLERNFKVEV